MVTIAYVTAKMQAQFAGLCIIVRILIDCPHVHTTPVRASLPSSDVFGSSKKTMDGVWLRRLTRVFAVSVCENVDFHSVIVVSGATEGKKILTSQIGLHIRTVWSELLLGLIYSISSKKSVRGQRRPCSDWAEVQADLGLHCMGYKASFPVRNID